MLRNKHHTTGDFFYFCLLFACLLAYAPLIGQTPTPSKHPHHKTHTSGHIDDPLVTKQLRLLITNQFSTYYIYRGAEKGLGFELLSLYLKDRKIKLHIDKVEQLKGLEDTMIHRNLHMAAATMGKPLDTLGSEVMTDYLYKMDGVLVRRKESPSPRTLNAPVKVYLIDDLPMPASLIRNKVAFPNIQFVGADTDATKQSLIEDVAMGHIDYTIASRLEAEIMQVFFPNLDVSEVLLPDVPVAYMVHPDCKHLLKDFNAWLAKKRGSSDFQWTIYKYKKFPQELRNAMTESTPITSGTNISHYDTLVRSYAKRIGWDWRLLSALIYQESKFNPKCKSYVGALGLMQVMPRTGYQFGKFKPHELYKPRHNLKAGTSFIAWMDTNCFKDPEISPENRQKFIIASYNAGYGHVIDARALAVKYGYDPNVWEGNVEKMMLAKSTPKYYNDKVCKCGYCRGQETVRYVEIVMTYYNHYLKYVQPE